MLKKIVQSISVRYKMMFAIFLIFVVPAGTLLTITNRIMIQNRLKSSIQSYQNNVRASENAIEGLREDLYTMGSRLSQTAWFKSIVYAYEASDLYSGNALHDLHMYNDQLATYTMINDQFSNIIVYFPNRDYIMSSMGLLYQKELPERLFHVLSMDDEEWSSILKTRDGLGFSSIQQISVNGNITEGILFKFAFPIESTNTLRANMIVYIRMETLAQLIEDSLKKDNIRLTVWSDGKLLYESGKEVNDSLHVIEYEGENLTIKCMLPESIVDVKDLKTTFLYLILLCFLAGILLAWTVSQYFYRPLTMILHKIGKTGAAGKGFQVQEYKLIESQISDIVRQEEMLRLRLKLQRPILLNSIFDMMLHDHYVLDEELKKLLDLLRVSFNHTNFRVAKLYLPDIDERKDIEDIICKMRRPQIELYFVWEDQVISLIMNYTDVRDGLDCLQAILSEIAGRCSEFSCGLGEESDDLLLITRSGKQADAALEQSYFSPVQTITFWHLEQQADETELQDNISDRIMARIIAGQPQQAAEELSLMIKKWRMSGVSAKAIKQAVGKCCYDLIDGNQELKINEELELYKPRFVNLDMDAARLNRMINVIGKTAIEYLEVQRQDYIRRMIDFVEDNLFNPKLSLTFLADAFGYSPSYISKLFKDMFSCNFLDYVMGKRIEQARNMLERTDKSISDIAREIGFNSDISFRRQFKSYTNITPSAYRLMHTGHGSEESEENEKSKTIQSEITTENIKNERKEEDGRQTHV